MNLVIDLGNTAAKVGIFDRHQLREHHVFADVNLLYAFLENFSFDSSIISSVSGNPERVNEHVNATNKLILTQNLPLPITNNYRTPGTLGVDRLGGVCGARALYPNGDCLVIDAGTCVTYDFVDASGTYHGGGISPGMSMRLQAVNTFTAKLPLVQPTTSPELIGNSTESCIQSGVVLGLAEEIKGFMGLYRERFGDLKVLLCGGDTAFFENILKGAIFAVPELVLIGLNSILNHNVNK